MTGVAALAAAVLVLGVGQGPARSAEPAREVSLDTADGGVVDADAYGDAGRPGVVLAPGAVFDRGSWRPLAEHLAAVGLQVIAIDFRGTGRSRPGTKPEARDEDVLAAVRWLRREGAPRVAAVGGSLGAAAVAQAAATAGADIERLALLSPAAIPDAARVPGRKLVVASADEPAVERVRAAYAALPEPKRLVLLPGTAHAQHIFATAQAAALESLLTDFVRGDDAP